MMTDLIAEKLTKWIGAGLRRERHDEDFRGARVELTFVENHSGDRTANEIVLTLSNGNGYRLKVQPFKVDLSSRVDTPIKLIVDSNEAA